MVTPQQERAGQGRAGQKHLSILALGSLPLLRSSLEFPSLSFPWPAALLSPQMVILGTAQQWTPLLSACHLLFYLLMFAVLKHDTCASYDQAGVDTH